MGSWLVASSAIFEVMKSVFVSEHSFFVNIYSRWWNFQSVQYDIWLITFPWAVGDSMLIWRERVIYQTFTILPFIFATFVYFTARSGSVYLGQLRRFAFGKWDSWLVFAHSRYRPSNGHSPVRRSQSSSPCTPCTCAPSLGSCLLHPPPGRNAVLESDGAQHQGGQTHHVLLCDRGNTEHLQGLLSADPQSTSFHTDCRWPGGGSWGWHTVEDDHKDAN